MKTNELRYFIVDNAAGPKPWKLAGGFHMRSETAVISTGYKNYAADGSLVAHTNHSGDVFWGGHTEGKNIVANGLEN